MNAVEGVEAKKLVGLIPALTPEIEQKTRSPCSSFSPPSRARYGLDALAHGHEGCIEMMMAMMMPFLSQPLLVIVDLHEDLLHIFQNENRRTTL